MPRVIASAPHFFVRDLLAAVRYYHELLGFSMPQLWGDPPTFAMPARNDHIVMLNQHSKAPITPNGDLGCWDAYFWCHDVDALHADMARRGARLVHPPVDRDLYGMREFAVKDLDGYMLAFAEDLARLRR